MSFAETLAQWRDFYMLAGTAAATLIGLLFVGLSLNISVIRHRTGVDLQELAGQSGNNFFYVLVIAVFFLIPNLTPTGLGILLLLLGAPGLIGTVDHFRKARKQGRKWGRTTVARRFAMPTISLAGVVVIAVSVLLGETRLLYGLVVVVIALLASGTQNAWDLLIHAGEEGSNAP